MNLAISMSNGKTITIQNAQQPETQQLVDNIRESPHQFLTIGVGSGQKILINKQQIVSLDLPEGIE